MSDYQDWMTPEHHAASIAATGVPLLTLSTQIDKRTVTVAATTSQTFGPFPVTQIAHELAISFGATNGSVHVLSVTLTWSDQASNITTDVDQFGIRAGAVGNPHVVRIFGRSKGNQVTVKLDNAGTGFDAQITYVWLQNSRVLQRETFRTLTWGVAPGDNLPNSNMPANLLAQTQVSVGGAGGQITRDLPAFAGDVWLFATTPSATSDLEVELLDEAITGNQLYHQFTDTHGFLSAQVTLPRTQAQLILTNHNAAAQVPNVAIVIRPPD